MQKEINYADVMALGFNRQDDEDSVFFDQYGYNYAIITKQLTKKISLDWDQPTRLCEMIRVNNSKDCDIKARMPIKNLDHLKEIIEFFED